jgi:glycosyltransferase involved in cell wall biosynthesis
MRVLLYCGGFAPIGGVETFAADLFKSLDVQTIHRSAIAWGRPPRQSPRMAEISAVADKFVRVPFRWGCRYGWPDRILLPFGRRMASRADLVIFPKIMPLSVHLAMRRTARRGRNRRPASVAIMHYRPAELWPCGADPRLWECFDVIVVQATAHSDDLRRLGYAGRIEILPYIPPALAPLRPPPRVDGAVQLGFLGRLERAKNLEYMFEIMGALQAASPLRFELQVFGTGTELSRLDGIVARSEFLKGRVRFRGPVDGEAKQRAIDSCEIFTNTAVTEGQNLVTLEVLARGRPMVATAVGALPEVLNAPELGALIPLADAKAAAFTFARVANAWRSGTITPQAIRSAFEQRFGREHVIRKYHQLFHELTTSD